MTYQGWLTLAAIALGLLATFLRIERRNEQKREQEREQKRRDNESLRRTVAEMQDGTR